MLGAGRDLWGSFSPTFLLKQVHLEQAAQDHIQMGYVECYIHYLKSCILTIFYMVTPLQLEKAYILSFSK